MNVFNSMPGMAEMGMVWMGSQQVTGEAPIGLIPPDASEMLLDHENMYYTPSRHSMSSQSIDDMHSTMQSSQMDTGESYDMMHFIDMKNESNDSYLDDDNSQPVYMITASTQTLPGPTRKIKPIKHPGLVLKTPIAYQGNTDPSVIPIQKDGIAVCEKCGAIGVKHAFYTRERRFCSMACARGYSGLIPEPLPQSNQDITDTKQHYARYRFAMKFEEDFSDSYIDPRLPQLEKLPQIDDTIPLVKRKPSQLVNSFSWDELVNDRYFVAAPVTCFKHAPMADIWENIMVGMKVEVENTDCDNVSDAFPDSFWVATVMRIVGYKAQLRYEGFGANGTKDFWVSLCSNQVHPVGWCATRGKPLIPPKTIEDKYSDWKDFLRKRLTGARTLPSNYSNKASESLKSRFEVGLNLEVVDKNGISQVRLAVIHKIIGKRLNVKYFDDLASGAGFWCHEDSPLLHPVGWARKVGQHLEAPISYIERISQGIFLEEDATEDLFVPMQVGSLDYNNSGFRVGMKLEAIDPLNLSSISVATVMEVLNYGFIMVRIDSYESDVAGEDWFCYHVKSPCIFPVGFCERHNVPLKPPKDYPEDSFDWDLYLSQTGTIPADPSLFNTYVPLHGFVPGMKIEAADLMDPRMVCVATIGKVVGRILQVKFDGWKAEYDQWLDCESCDIYPVGWCQSVGHKLEAPGEEVDVGQPKQTKVKKKTRKKKIKENSKNSSFDGSSSASHSIKNIKNETPEVEPQEEIHEDDHHSACLDIKSEISEEPEPLDQTPPSNSEPLESEPIESEPFPIIASTSTSPKVIPRLVDNGILTIDDSSRLCPLEWNMFDVGQFLRVNDCANYCDAFSKQKITGKMLLNLKKEDILEYTCGKVGPSLKIFDLIQQLKSKAKPRHMSLIKKVL
ncbi:unnamed protein product [Ceutorhynchus assimilis]|uniref:Polycomb protein Sfmbt n=1 Tax=Ceutorhynchus assimilis TaxID=467358 RepID=A0A9P0DD98_9CUCU|nr:unnamed protein product [Ceutorhynchus assimilis]